MAFWQHRGSRKVAQTSTRTSAAPKQKGCFRACLGAFPLGVLLASLLTAAGLTLYIIFDIKAARSATTVLQQVRGGTDLLSYIVTTYSLTIAVTAALVGVSLALCLGVASGRMGQRIRQETTRPAVQTTADGGVKRRAARSCAKLGSFLVNSLVYATTLWLIALLCVAFMWWSLMIMVEQGASNASSNLQGAGGAPGVLTKDAANGTALCPSAACLDLTYYALLESDGCVCNSFDVDSIKDAVHDTRNNLNIVLIGLSAMIVGITYLLRRMSSDIAALRYGRAPVLAAQPLALPYTTATNPRYAHGTEMTAVGAAPVYGHRTRDVDGDEFVDAKAHTRKASSDSWANVEFRDAESQLDENSFTRAQGAAAATPGHLDSPSDRYGQAARPAFYPQVRGGAGPNAGVNMV